MRAPLLLLLVSLQIIHLAESGFASVLGPRSSVLGPRQLNACTHLMTRYGQCLAESIIIRRYPQCCLHPVFQNNKGCRWLKYYRRKKRAVGCNPSEHAVVKVKNTKPYEDLTCDSLINQIKKSDTFKCPEAIKKCGTDKVVSNLPNCCEHPVMETEIGCKPTTTTTTKPVNTNKCITLIREIRNNRHCPKSSLIRNIRNHNFNCITKCREANKKCSRSMFQRYIPTCCYHPEVKKAERTRCSWARNYRRKRADFDNELLDHSPGANYGSSEASDHSLWNITEKSTNNLPPMFLEADVTTSNTSLDVSKYRGKRAAKSVIPVLSTSLMDELTENSPEAISVTCCGDPTNTKYCGAGTGIRCSTVCGNQAVDAVDMVESDDVCNPEITGGDSGRRRRKRSWSAATMASWKINWCTRKVSSGKGGNIWWYRICCYHPSVAKHRYTYSTPWTKDDNEKTVGTFCHHKVSKTFRKTRMG